MKQKVAVRELKKIFKYIFHISLLVFTTKGFKRNRNSHDEMSGR